MWLRDLLPNIVPNARIATYSYESDWRNADIKTSLRKCGEQLLNVLLQNRSTEKVGVTISGVLHSFLLTTDKGDSTTISVHWTQSWRPGHQTG